MGVLRDRAGVDDALQATFGKLLTRGHTADRDRIRSWLFRVAYNEAMLWRRSEAGRREKTEQAAWSLTQGRPTPEPEGLERLTHRESLERTRQALQELPTVTREILRLRIYEERKFREIAEELNLPLGTVLSKAHTALQKLKLILVAEWGDPNES